MNDNNYNFQNTLTYQNVGPSGPKQKQKNPNIPFDDPKLRKNKSTVVLMLIFELILTAAALYLCFVEGMWPAAPYLFFLVCLFTTLFSSPDYSLKPMVIITIIESIVCGGIFALRITYPFAFEKISEHIYYCGASVVVLSIGAGLVIYTLVNTGYYKKKCNVPVQGRVVSHKETLASTKHGFVIVYCPEYEYFYNGDSYRSYDFKYHKFINPPIGEIRTIFIDPEYPITLREPKRTAALNRRRMFFGISFVIIGVMLLFLWSTLK